MLPEPQFRTVVCTPRAPRQSPARATTAGLLPSRRALERSPGEPQVDLLQGRPLDRQVREGRTPLYGPARKGVERRCRVVDLDRYLPALAARRLDRQVSRLRALGQGEVDAGACGIPAADGGRGAFRHDGPP